MWTWEAPPYQHPRSTDWLQRSFANNKRSTDQGLASLCAWTPPSHGLRKALGRAPDCCQLTTLQGTMTFLLPHGNDSWRYAHVDFKHYPCHASRPGLGHMMDFDATLGFPGEGPRFGPIPDFSAPAYAIPELAFSPIATSLYSALAWTFCGLSALSGLRFLGLSWTSGLGLWPKGSILFRQASWRSR